MKLEKETLVKLDARSKSVAFEIDNLKPVQTVMITAAAKSSMDCTRRVDINMGNIGNQLNLSEKMDMRNS